MANKYVPIKYTSREFESIKQDLVDYAKRYYPNTQRDFNEASFGALMLDTVAYVGDILSFYLDYQANESFMQTAVEYENIIKLARQNGYKFQGNLSSYGRGTIYVVVPALTTGLGPDPIYIPKLKKGSQFRSTSGAPFMLAEDIDFSTEEKEVRVHSVDDTTGVPLFYAIRGYGNVVSGQLGQEIVTVGSYEAFKRIQLSATNVTEVISVIDSEGHDYYAVDFLSQDVIWQAVTNRSNDLAAEILKPFVVPRRFIVDRNKTATYLQFGAGQETDIAENNEIADPASVVLQVHGKNYITDEAFDPSKLIKSEKFGLAPSNTNLRIEYRTNSTSNVNVAVGGLNQVVSTNLEFSDITALTASKAVAVRNSIEIENEEQIVGSISLPTTKELKHRVAGSYAAQNRAVTEEDYQAMVYQMPPKFGGIKRVRVIRDHNSFKRNLNMYVIAEDEYGNLTEANDTLKRNLKTWLLKNKMIHDTIDILDAKIVNIAIDYVVVAALDGANNGKFEILSRCQQALATEYKKKLEIGEPFWVTDVYKVLNRVAGVVDTSSTTISTRTGGLYSDTRFNIKENMSADGRYIEVPKNVILEVKLPNVDIKGVIK